METTSPVAYSGTDAKENDADPATAIAIQTSDETAPSSQHSTPQPPCPRVQAEDSVAYITVSDPVQHTEGLKGKFTMYRVAYDPPPPAADADVIDADGGARGKHRALFPYATSANRRYSDFAWLFDHLHKERPGAIVPPLPEKQKVARFSESFIEERRLHLEAFLRRAASNPELIDTECLLVFFGRTTPSSRRRKRTGASGRPPPARGRRPPTPPRAGTTFTTTESKARTTTRKTPSRRRGRNI